MRFRKRTLRLYIYHNRYQEITVKNNGLPKTLFDLIFNICYYAGLSLIYTLISPFLLLRFGLKQLGKDIRNTKHHLTAKIRNLRVLKKWRMSMALFLLFVMAGWGSFHSFILAAEAQKVKDKILVDANKGVESLTAGGVSLKDQNSELAQQHFQEALQNFDKIQTDLENNGLLINSILKVIPQRDDADKLTESAKLATEVGASVASLYQQFNNIKITAQGVNGGGQNGENLVAILNQFKIATEKITRVTQLLEKVDASLIPEDKRKLFLEVQTQLGTIRKNLAIGAELSDLLGNILLGQKEVLVMFENNNELRPTGGFLGTFGAMKLNNGVIEKLHISSIYDLDGQLKTVINPPKPLYAVNDRWFLRDSNWFVDFPTTARKITDFYEKEGGTTPDMVIALTPSVVTDLLKVTGPITVPNYKVTLSSENFIEMTQLETSVKYDKSLNKPKQFLADFFPLFLQKLSTLEGGQSIATLGTFQKNLQSKEIMIYAKNDELQNKLKKFHWSGEVLSTDRDYLSIISANLGGTKTDIGLVQKAKLTSTIDSDGEIINNLTFTRKNPFPRKPGFENKSFLRILVPEGSTLISTDGFSPSPLPSIITPKGVTDNEVKNWENGAVQDIASGTLIGTESGKTFFGNWLITEGGEEKTVSISYKLPFKLDSTDRFSLLFQKQSGVEEYPISYTVEHPDRELGWQNRNPDSVNENSASYNIVTSIDQFFGLILQKK